MYSILGNVESIVQLFQGINHNHIEKSPNLGHVRTTIPSNWEFLQDMNHRFQSFLIQNFVDKTLQFDQGSH